MTIRTRSKLILAAAATALAACACPDKPVAPKPMPRSAHDPEPVRKAARDAMPPTTLTEAHVKPHPPGTARDDLPHLRKELAWLARVGDCLPQDQELGLALDAFDNHLVACVQVMTRRDVSVQSDPVSYACWNLDPATGNATKRADLGRSYFRCQDGACAPGFPTTRWISHDGAHEVVAGNDEVAIARRPGGAPVRKVKLKHEGETNMRDTFTLLGPWLIHIDQSNNRSVARIHDERGTVRGELPAIEVHVVDAGHILATPLEGDMTLVELATGKRTTVIHGAEYLSTMVRFGGTFYAVDGRRLVALDPATLQPARAIPLRTCPVPP